MSTALRLSLCGLCFYLALLGPATGAPLADPPPVNCLLTRWSDWTECDPCTNQKRRSRGIQVFGQFGGQPCAGSLGERQACVPRGACLQSTTAPCAHSQFQCASGRCIGQRLECNYDLDCEDQSDEHCADVGRKPCGTRELEANDHAMVAGYGVNILGSSPADNPFFNEFFNGLCRQSWDPMKQAQIRLPWNVAVLNYETTIEETLSSDVHESSHTLIHDVLKDVTNNVDGGMSFKFGQGAMAPEIGGTVGHETSDIVKNIITSITTKKKKYIRLKGKIQFASFRMRAHGLEVAERFLDDVRFLPLVYEKSAYFDFLEQYGTHYTRYGKLGGEYQLVYELDSDVLERSNVDEHTVKDCLTIDVKISIGAMGSGNIKPKNCETVTTKNTDSSNVDGVVDNVFISVKGGSTPAAAALKASITRDGSMSPDAYTEWARSVVLNPALVHSEPEPIYTVLPLDMPHVNIRVAHLKRAIADYVAEYNVCKCQPCQNGGTVVLIDGACTCLCSLLYKGKSCQNYKPDKTQNPAIWPSVAQVGNWGCWGSWTSCQANQHRSRTRQCNQQGLQGGASCSGPAHGEEQC